MFTHLARSAPAQHGLGSEKQFGAKGALFYPVNFEGYSSYIFLNQNIVIMFIYINITMSISMLSILQYQYNVINIDFATLISLILILQHW